MTTLAIDIETFSSADLTKTGVYKYAEAADFTILLFGYSIDGEPVEIIDLAAGDEMPFEIVAALQNKQVLKTAYNANFERTCIAKYFNNNRVNLELPASQWECTMAKSSMLGLPLGLDAVTRALRLEETKMFSGKILIRYFSMPCKPTKVNGGRTRNLPEHDPEKWDEFKKYCTQDVVTEQAVRNKISFFDISDTEKKLWALDQQINDKGVLLDPQFIRNAIKFDVEFAGRLSIEAVQLTGLENPNSVSQLKQWMSDSTGSDVSSLTKEAIPVLLENISSQTVKRVLQIRQEMAKTSVKKYMAMSKAICKDNRVRGIHQYYGANRTGRWAGRLVQPQNMPQNHLPDLDMARKLVREGDTDMLEILFGNVPDTLSQLIRTAFIGSPGHRFIITDFAAIEARVIAWLAGETWRTEVFKTHGKIYEASGAHMFKVPIEDVIKGSALRQKAKIAELALGYGGGPNALLKMGAIKMGLIEEELPKLVAMWRNANKAIVRYWQTVENCAIASVEDNMSQNISHLQFYVDRGILFIQLPSGRKLAYLRPKLKLNKFGGQSLTYEGMSQTKKLWIRQETYGGKLVENIVQAVARDCLADAMLRLDLAGYNIVMHVHDEVVLEMADGTGSTQEVSRIMSQSIPWAKGLPLAADSYESVYYKKD